MKDDSLEIKDLKEFEEDEINEEMIKISEMFCLKKDTLLNLSRSAKETIFADYLHGAGLERIHEIMNSDYTKNTLYHVSKLIKVPKAELEKLPNDLQEQMCGLWLFEQGIVKDEVIEQELIDMMNGKDSNIDYDDKSIYIKESFDELLKMNEPKEDELPF